MSEQEQYDRIVELERQVTELNWRTEMLHRVIRELMVDNTKKHNDINVKRPLGEGIGD